VESSLWTIQGHDAFENTQGYAGRYCPLLPQAMSIENKGFLRVHVPAMKDHRIGMSNDNPPKFMSK